MIALASSAGPAVQDYVRQDLRFHSCKHISVVVASLLFDADIYTFVKEFSFLFPYSPVSLT
jgi:hypothetical protein